MKELAYSLDESLYENYDSIFDQIEEDGNIEFVYVGEKVEQTHSNFLYMDYLFESMSEQAYEVGYEWSEDYLDDAKDHKVSLKKIILEYMDKNITQPNFFLIENVKKITVEEFNKCLDSY
jgi:hypothetical protein